MPHSHQHAMHAAHLMNNPNLMAAAAAVQMRAMPPPHGGPSRFSNSRSSHEIGRSAYMAHQQQMHNQQQQQQQRGLYLELDQRDRGCMEGSPPSDNVIFDNQCYATTPSSSNGNSDQDQPYGQRGPGRHTHHHQVDTVAHLNSFQLAHLFSSSIPESAECYAGPRFAHITTAARVWDALAEHAGQGNGRRVLQSAHVRGTLVAEHGELRAGRKSSRVQSTKPISTQKT